MFKKVNKLVVMSAMLLLYSIVYARSPQRKKDPSVPMIITRWQGADQSHSLSYYHLQEKPFFHLFDPIHFFEHLLPLGPIVYRHGTGTICGESIANLIEQLIEEIQKNKNTYTHFTILKKRDFNKRDKTGLIIVKLKEYPFVIKLFMETPESFVYPLSKGFEPTCFFLMGGGVNRHLNGFTRIKNLLYLRQKIASDHYWAHRVDFPRKWFWLPKNPQWIELEGFNMGKNPQITKKTLIPAVYAIVCDYIDVERTFSLTNIDDRNTALELSNFFRQSIDPHINNYGIERQTKKIVPLDTEHFPTMVGYQEPPYCQNYLQWYLKLSLKMLKDCIGTTKKERRALQCAAYTCQQPL